MSVAREVHKLRVSWKKTQLGTPVRILHRVLYQAVQDISQREKAFQMSKLEIEKNTSLLCFHLIDYIDSSVFVSCVYVLYNSTVIVIVLILLLIAILLYYQCVIIKNKIV